ncbi:hypothetical protein D0B54_08215 [Solimonas sp. K1W22B-7]|uniref:Calx-beta domain-containing protein n=1 Tax=Solimonas sp. K1W22B-7 TaxID=2303331 RepID=UPI000E337559|nr:Calx-beta domain-containing protein [Solimonas sp. K1W22B-7]AXQ28664.1 hypothetical protein D0B54_08215 [Solimonas sp. K1W22B-7]
MKRVLMLLGLLLGACGGGGGGGEEAPVLHAGQFSFGAASYSAAENAGSVVVSVQRLGGSDGAVSVAYASGGGSAAAPGDHAAVQGRLEWPAGDAAPRSITVPIVNDALREGDETVLLSLSAPVGGAALASPSQATLTIRDDDPAVPGQLQFEAASYSVVEDQGTVQIRVQRTGGSDGAVGVSYAVVDGNAAAGTDYIASSGTLAWGDREEGSNVVLIQLVDNDRLDGSRTLVLELSAPTGGASLGTRRRVTLTIQDNEKPQPGRLQFGAVAYQVAENAGTALVTVTRSGGSNGAVGLSYATADDTARTGTEYTAVSGKLSWADGDVGTKTFAVPILDDAVRDRNKKLGLRLSAATGGAVLGTASVSLTILDNEPAQTGTLQFGAAAQDADETAGSVTIAVTRTGGIDGAVSVRYAAAGGTAVAGSDYAAFGGTLSWADGDGAVKTFAVRPLNDSAQEDSETLVLRLSDPLGATLGSLVTSTLTLRDDDKPLPLELVEAFPALSFDDPVFLLAERGDDSRLYLVEQAGRIRVFANDDAVTAAATFVDISLDVDSGGESGLLGMAFDPGFASNGYVYLHYVSRSRGQVVSRFHALSRDSLDVSSEQVLLELGRSGAHNGGWIGFGPDGHLYVTVGDHLQPGNGQRLDVLQGKVLRITTSGSAPADNPFVGTAGARPEIWAYGFRNPWRASFDRANGQLWLGDVGENTREEIDRVERGGNFGWSSCEGTLCGTAPSGHRPPALEYGHGGGGASVNGGYVYRSAAIAEAVGLYFFADFITGQVWYARSVSGRLVMTQFATLDYPSSMGEDAAGELYVVSYNGKLYRLARR